MALTLILVSTFLISLIALIGMVTLSIKEKILNKLVLGLVAFSAGTLLGGAFIHLIPEATESCSDYSLFVYVLMGFLFFLVMEKLLHWRHCHKKKCKHHTFGYINLIGDGIHNFIDGLIIAPAFMISPGLGIATTMAIAFHEVPQEIGDFGVLIYSGLKKKKALILNFIAALTVVIGGLTGYFISNLISASIPFLLSFAAGGFIYIAAVDLTPEIKKETDLKKSAVFLIILALGMGLMYLLKGL